VAIRAVISDFGGVLTTPLLNSFMAFQDETGIPAGALGRAMQGSPSATVTIPCSSSSAESSPSPGSST
jgi:hypothetical protein